MVGDDRARHHPSRRPTGGRPRASECPAARACLRYAGARRRYDAHRPSTMSASVRHPQAGFALIESICVLALSSLVLLSLIIAGDLVTRKSGATARHANQSEALMTGLSALRRDIDATEFARGAGDKAPVLFQGASETLGLATAARGYGENLVWIAVQRDGDRKALVRSTAAL